MTSKNEKTLSPIADEQLGTVSGAGVYVNGDLSFLSNVAKASKGGVATAGDWNQVDSSKTEFALLAGLLPVVAVE